MTHWSWKVLEAIAENGAGSYIIDLPAYRPDLVDDVGRTLALAHVDFRRERMAPLGMAAHKLELSAIADCVRERSNDHGIVLHNAEALLATRPEAVRRDWLRAFLAEEHANLVLLPLALYGHEVDDNPRIIRFAASDLPEETLLRQLSSMRLQ